MSVYSWSPFKQNTYVSSWPMGGGGYGVVDYKGELTNIPGVGMVHVPRDWDVGPSGQPPIVSKGNGFVTVTVPNTPQPTVAYRTFSSGGYSPSSKPRVTNLSDRSSLLSSLSLDDSLPWVSVSPTPPQKLGSKDSLPYPDYNDVLEKQYLSVDKQAELRTQTAEQKLLSQLASSRRPARKRSAVSPGVGTPPMYVYNRNQVSGYFSTMRRRLWGK